ncbi:MAG: 3-hydroxyacyl-CoA dehydrogenase [Acidiferrobacteraceae bacterium]|nr:3-hydroxyacyl-CoA dehydrogenase [Acidiferrobacteraceae bacterium]
MVIGAGVMGAGIAAQIANAGLPVALLDVVPANNSNRNAIPEKALAQMLKAKPSPLMASSNIRNITPGNIDDDLHLAKDCDLIIEAVVENIEIKKELYLKLEKQRKTESIVTSNTSTIPLSHLVADLPRPLATNFAITHFFNPPRYMRLLELVGGPETNSDALEALTHFCDVKLGKSVVRCKDTPGFIANRIGIYWMESAVRYAIEMGLSVEEADAVVGKPMGIPKTGVFGLMDLVGIDLQPHVQQSMLALLPDNDPYRDIYQASDLLDHMIKTGYTGRKGKGGFYRLNSINGKKIKEVLDLKTMTYRPTVKPELGSIAAGRHGMRALVEHADIGGQYAWRVLSKTLSYSASLVPEIADDVYAIDEAMKNGYAWKWGPFEIIDQLGPQWFANKLRSDQLIIPPLLKAINENTFYTKNIKNQQEFFTANHTYKKISRPNGVLMLSDIKRQTKRINGNPSASIWDIGDAVLCLEFHTKMNSLDTAVFEMMEIAIREVKDKHYQALVIHNEGANFSAGVNLGLALFAANIAAWPEITKSVAQGQKIYKAIKYAPFPVVAAPSGMALGGGCELLLHCDGVQAHAETYTGLVEVGVGLVPAWGGCKELLARWSQYADHPKGPMTAITKVFEIIGTAKIATSALEAKQYLFLTEHDGITMNRNRLLADAKTLALSLVENYSPPEKPVFFLPGESARLALTMVIEDMHRNGKINDHDVTVAQGLAIILSGGNTDIVQSLTEEQILSLERKTILSLVKMPQTLARMEHMLETGKPLRN